MEKGNLDDRQDIPLAFRAEEALKEAVAEAIAHHKRSGAPIAVWRDDKVCILPADQIEIRETATEYRTLKKKNKK